MSTRRAFLRAQNAMSWLRRYNLVTRQASMGFALFRRQLHILSIIFGKVVNPDCPSSEGIPVPRVAGRVTAKDLDELSSAYTTLHSSGGESYTHNRQQTRIREMVSLTRDRVCKDVQRCTQELCTETVTAFSAKEVYQILDSAHSLFEKLIVVLFLTTGLRIGGLSRLRLPEVRNGTTIPDCAITVEKGRQPRKILLTVPLKSLIQAYREEHGFVLSPFVFPSPRHPESQPISKSRVWMSCRAVFMRAGLGKAKYAHPHTFRHTVVRMLYISGRPFDVIAKFLGHKNKEITMAVYGRLTCDETHRQISGDSEIRDQDKEVWTAVMRRIRDAPFTNESSKSQIPDVERITQMVLQQLKQTS